MTPPCAPAVVAEDVVERGHPCLTGHFPGRPIVPAVVLLEKVADAFEAEQRGMRVAGVSESKFARPVLPDQPFAIHLGELRADRVAFEIRTAAGTAARGRLIAEPR